MITMTIGSFKGGTSKTTSSLNIGYSLSILGKKVVLIDFDPQGNLTSYIGCSNNISDGVSEIFHKKTSLSELILRTKYQNLSLLPSSKYFEDYREFNLNILGTSENVLFNKLSEISDNFDFCIIDTPPSLGLINKIAYSASDYVLPCIGMDPFSVLGLQKMFDYIDGGFDYFNTKILGIIISFWEKRSSIGRVLDNILNERYPKLSFLNKIHRDVSVNKSIIIERPLFHSFSKSKASKDYFSLTKEILNRIYNKKISVGEFT